ncbi:TonB-dependent outer membrane receptor [Sterolibacterium denitrificans]|uniref:TonB-dependent outer membrane receptor n=1 Tax=Sterolibacterium denitrificans TaxID=157592 RepID=A0A7Z7MUE9_9PROT|nr:TonB-dependent receptor [Sterolibacterium denitrificans]SMB22697.1 TonB-dependent outer membrane receptor [Sterolibacterium denitrificans]
MKPQAHPLPNTRPTLIALAMASALASGSVLAQTSAPPSGSVFTLGTVVVSATAPQSGGISEDQVASVVTSEEIQQFNRENIADALNLLSGITLSHGQKNERRVSIRGFETSKVGLFIDGIPVYIPFDGAVDMNRFTTADLAAIQVAKGFTSVAYGPNTMAGAINLVTRKPVKQLEGNVQLGFGEGNERKASVNVGSNQGLWYIQGGVSYLESDWFRMSSSFVPKPGAALYEDGGERNNSYRKDSKVSLKFGLTPNATDEYAISYLKQEGEKGQPTSTAGTGQTWRWPYWNKESVYLTTRTALGANETLKFKLYHDTFDNAIDMYTNATFTTINGTGSSIYNDKTYGGSVELESTRIKDNTLRLFAFYKKDIHDKNDYSYIPPRYDRMEDTLVSYALENNYQIRSDLLLSLGASHHELKPNKIYKSDNLTLTLPGSQSANDFQAGLFHDWSSSTRLYATASKKTRLPSLQDRYNGAQGRYIENPNLQPEKSVNYEIGYQGTPWQNAKAEAAIFHSTVDNKIQDWYPDPSKNCTAPTVPDPVGNVCQRRNVGEVRYSGIELGLRGQVSAQLELGGNYTHTEPKIISNPNSRSGAKVYDVPKRKATVHARYRPAENLDFIAFVENNSKRWVSDTVELGAYTTLNLKVAYRPMKDLTLEAGVNNAGDKNYEFSSGFPQPGRMWFANGVYTF